MDTHDAKSRLVPSPPLGWVRSQSGRKQLVPTLPLPPSAPPGQQRTVVLAWGSNTAGQLGLGDFLTRVMPAPVDSLAQTTVLSLVCGSRTTLALDREGRVFAWGKGDDGQLGIGERGTVARPRLVTALLRHPIAQLACRGAHVLALDAAGQVWAWGRNDDGQLGVNASAGDGGSPSASHGAGDERELAGRPQRVEALGGRRVTTIGCGRTHSVALTAQGALRRVARALGLGFGLGLLWLG